MRRREKMGGGGTSLTKETKAEFRLRADARIVEAAQQPQLLNGI